MADFLITLLGISAVMTVMIAIVIIAGGLLKKKVRAASRYIIWLLIIARLCIPVSAGILPTVINIPAPEAVEESESAETAPALQSKPTPPETLPVQQGGAIITPDVQETVPTMGETVSPSPIVTPDKPEQPEPQAESELPAISFDFVLSIIFSAWAAGALIFITYDITKYTQFSRELRESLTAADKETMMIYEALCAEMKIKKAPVLHTAAVRKVPFSSVISVRA